MNLWEVSACGIPMYPKAHKSFSLSKSLEDEESQLNFNEEEKPMEESEQDNSESSETSEETEEKSEETEEKTEEKTEETSEETEKSVVSAEILKGLKDAMREGFKEAINQSKTERGLFAEKSIDEQMKETLQKKSIGELAVMNGLFQKPPVVGSGRGF